MSYGDAHRLMLMQVVGIAMQRMHQSYKCMKAQQKKLSGCASNLLAHEDLGHLRKPIVGIYKSSSIMKSSHQYMKVTKQKTLYHEDYVTILFTTLVLQSSTIIFMIESLLFCHFHILVGIFHYRTWLVYSNNGLPQMPQVFVSKQVGCTPTQFLLLSFHTFIALVHLLHGNPYSSC